jgi:hypothetical protein
MHFQMEEGIQILSQTPAVLDALLRGKSNSWLNAKRSADAFSAIEVLGHLMHGELTDWIPRVRIILEHGDKMAFEPFDRFAFQSLIANKTVDQLLDEFAAMRLQSLQCLHELGVTEDHLKLPGLHPELGAVTMGQLLANWAVHDLAHIAQIVKTMACAYREEIGPWRAYTSIVD